MEGVLGKAYLGGASAHIKALDSTLIPQKRNSCTEGIWGQYHLSMLGRTLHTHHIQVSMSTKKFIIIHILCIKLLSSLPLCSFFFFPSLPHSLTNQYSHHPTSTLETSLNHKGNSPNPTHSDQGLIIDS